jgi:predicted phage-related endonuclease
MNAVCRGRRFNFFQFQTDTVLGEIPPRNDLWDEASQFPARRLAE